MVRSALILAGLALLPSCGAVIFDPAWMDSEIKACNRSLGGEGSGLCGPDRYCTVDPPRNNAGTEMCLHKELFTGRGFSRRDLAGSLVLLSGMALAATAGIGGGGLNVPVLLSIFNFNMDEAVVLSNTAVLGNGFAQFLVNWRQRNPHDRRRPLVDWDAVLILLPAQLGGGNIGVVVEKIFPATVLMLMAVLLLLFAAIKVGKC